MRQLTIRFNLREAGVGAVAVYGAVLKLHGAYIDSDSPVTWAPVQNFTVHAVEFCQADGAVDARNGRSVHFNDELRTAVIGWMERRLDEGEYSFEIQDIADKTYQLLAVCDE